MAFLVEDGTGLSTATSYVSVADFDDYWADRNIVYTQTNAEKQAALIKGTQYIDKNFRFIGVKASSTQSLQWPRWYAYSPEGYVYTGIPNDLIWAVCEASAIALVGTDLFVSTEQEVQEKTENVGPVETTYKYRTTQTSRIVYQAVQTYIKFLVKGRTASVRRY